MIMFCFTKEIGLHCFTENQTNVTINIFEKWLKMNQLTGKEREYVSENFECKIREIVNEIEQKIINVV